MKNRLNVKALWLIVLFMILIPKPSLSQDLFFGGGISLPSNPSSFSDTYKTGANFEIGYLWGASTFDNTAFELGFSYDTFGLSIPEGSDVSGGRLALINVKFGARYFLGDPEVGKSNFYLAAGYGRYTMSVDNLKSPNFTVEFEEQQGNSLNFGIGVIMPNNYFTNFDLRYKTIYTSGEHNLSFLALRLILM